MRDFFWIKMMLEIELKLVLKNSSDIPAFLENPLLQLLPTQQNTLYTTYFDTHQAILRKNKMALRIRQDAATSFTQTIKKNVLDSVQALQKNREWDAEVKDFVPDLTNISDQDLRIELTTLLKNTALIPLFSTNFLRTTWLYRDEGGVEVEIALDQGFIICGESRTAICEIELELKRGIDECVLYALAAQLGNNITLSSDTSSKAKRGYELAYACGAYVL